jgi:hypothetical protein
MGRHSDALLARAVNVALAPKYSQKSRAVSETVPDFSLHPPPPQGSSPYVFTGDYLLGLMKDDVPRTCRYGRS